MAIEQLEDRIESIQELPNQNKLAIDRIDEKFDEKFEDQNEINQDIRKTLGNKIEGLVERIEPLEEQEQRLRRTCPVGEQYKLIHGVCYFFDTTKRNLMRLKLTVSKYLVPQENFMNPKQKLK